MGERLPASRPIVLQSDDWYRSCESQSEECSGDVTYAADPFSAEVCGDRAPVWMCDHHREQRFLDS